MWIVHTRYFHYSAFQNSMKLAFLSLSLSRIQNQSLQWIFNNMCKRIDFHSSANLRSSFINTLILHIILLGTKNIANCYGLCKHSVIAKAQKIVYTKDELSGKGAASVVCVCEWVLRKRANEIPCDAILQLSGHFDKCMLTRVWSMPWYTRIHT